tara:strand:- start:5470 stop:7479 length:2010 start_codon:yes stop_codon:yes gene_type:complete
MSQIQQNKWINTICGFGITGIILNALNSKILPAGWLGIDILFVVYGYIIASSLDKISNKNILRYCTYIYKKKLSNSFPKIAIFVIFTSVLICLFNPQAVFSLRTGFSSLLGASNLYLLRTNDPDTQRIIHLNPFSHTWALGVYAQYYFILPIVYWISGYANRKEECNRKLISYIFILCILSLLSFIYYANKNLEIASLLMPLKMWEFCVGNIAYLTKNVSSKKYSLWIFNNIKILTLILLILFFTPNFFALQAIIITVITTFLLIKNLENEKRLPSFFNNRKIIYIGKISTSLYLWYNPVIAISHWTIGVQWWTIPILLIVLIIIGAYFENLIKSAKSIFIRSTNSFTKPNQYIIGLSLISTILTGVYNQKSKLYLGSKPEDLSEGYKIKTSKINSYHRGKYCWAEVGKDLNIEDCSLGNRNNPKKRIVVIGNSILQSFLQAFDIFINNDYYITIIPGMGIASLPNLLVWHNTIEYKNHYWGKIVPELIETMNPNDILFLVAETHNQIESDSRPPKWQINYEDYVSKLPNMNPPELNLSIFETDLISLLEELKAQGIKLAVLRPLPDPTDCYGYRREWFNKLNKNEQCKFSDKTLLIKERSRINKILSNIENKYPESFRAVNLFDFFCPKKECSYYDDKGNLLFNDGIHPTPAAAKLFQKTLYDQLKDF